MGLCDGTTGFKINWDELHFGDPNPYASLPTLNIYTYDLGRLLHDFVDEDVAFNFREFFRVNEAGGFCHEKDVRAFLNLLTKEDKDSLYPYANEEYRNIFRHTLWMVPGVKEARALSAMLQTHPVFQHFKVVNVAGDGDQDEESRDALEAVEQAIGKRSGCHTDHYPFLRTVDDRSKCKGMDCRIHAVRFL